MRNGGVLGSEPTGQTDRDKENCCGGEPEHDCPLPNESRLSCGAEMKCPQTECYHTACRMFSEPVVDGRRQLQALVRHHGAVTARSRQILRANSSLISRCRGTVETLRTARLM